MRIGCNPQRRHEGCVGSDKEVSTTLADALEVQKSNELHITKLLKDISVTAMHQVSKDAKTSQRVAKVQATHDANISILREQQRRNEKLVPSLEATQRELGRACKDVIQSHAATAALQEREAGSTKKLQEEEVDLSHLRGCYR
ncbi:hypothetical protein R1flu_017138 [Riccia fluitans]|uniref:Uncharacterized protein n=1 Tax=Riccia fluitans TaxID=41844 RepID=A0ABD1YSS1_9MARC